MDLELKINSQTIWPTPKILPRIHATQVLQDFSDTDLANLVETHRLESDHGGASFGLSYRKSLHRIQGSSAAFLFRFDIFEIFPDVESKPVSWKLDSEQQKILELIVLEKPILSAGDAISYEIIKASLVPRPTTEPGSSSRVSRYTQEMRFTEWDEFGQLHTVSHFLSHWGDSFIGYLSSGVWGMASFVFFVMFLFALVCAIIILGCQCCEDDEMDYAGAQQGKEKVRRRKTGDEEKRVGFKTAEELGLLGRGRGGRVVGIGKSD